MSNVWLFLGLWFLLSLIVAPIVGKFIAFGMGSDQEMEKPRADLQ